MRRFEIKCVSGLICFIFFLQLGCSNSKALEYNNELMGYQGKVIDKMIELTETFEKPDAATMSMKLKELEKAIDECIVGVSAIKGFEGDISLRDVVLNLLKFYKDISGNEYQEMISILGRIDAPITQSDLDRMNQMNQDISQREIVLDKKMEKVQQAFAKKYNFMLTRNEKQEDVDALGKENKQ